MKRFRSIKSPNLFIVAWEKHLRLKTVNQVKRILTHQFSNTELLKEALSHPSVSSEKRPAPPDNQRLEYLGDAVLELIISDYLFNRFPDCQEGVLTKLRASIVSRQALCAIAQRYHFGDSLSMSKGEELSGGRTRASNLADAVEAVIGALYMDAGFERTKIAVLKVFAPELEALDPQSAQASNSKGALQEILQKKAPESPIYSIVKVEGPPHDRIFSSEVTWREKRLGTGKGASKKTAEADAAAAALEARLWENV